MRPARIILVVVALVAGGLAALLVMRMGRAPAPQTEVVTQVVQEAKTQVLVAKAAIGIGERLNADTLQWQDWPDSALRPEFITAAADPDALSKTQGSVARVDFVAGDPIVAQKLAPAGGGFLSAILSTGMRAVSPGPSFSFEKQKHSIL